jgi:hypothetical protein
MTMPGEHGPYAIQFKADTDPPMLEILGTEAALRRTAEVIYEAIERGVGSEPFVPAGAFVARLLGADHAR